MLATTRSLSTQALALAPEVKKTAGASNIQARLRDAVLRKGDCVNASIVSCDGLFYHPSEWSATLASLAIFSYPRPLVDGSSRLKAELKR